eukprot:scaffold25039_cov69-Phaeocystis_antarctica.AAC.4
MFSLRSTALHTAAVPKVAAHVLLRIEGLTDATNTNSRSEQPVPISSGTTRLATAVAIVVWSMGICI